MDVQEEMMDMPGVQQQLKGPRPKRAVTCGKQKNCH
jgi:hypothetical protein